MCRHDAAACEARDGRACRSYSWPRAPPSMIVVMFVFVRPPASASRRSVGSGVLSARLRAPLLMARSRHSTDRQIYAPRPAARPLKSSTTSPAGVRTTRMRSRFGRTVRHATQVRSGARRGATGPVTPPTTPPLRSARRRRPSSSWRAWVWPPGPRRSRHRPPTRRRPPARRWWPSSSRASASVRAR